MNPFAKIAAIAGGIVAIGGAVTAWDKFDLNRPIMKTELRKVADELENSTDALRNELKNLAEEAEDTRVKVLIQLIDAGRQRLDDLAVLKIKLQTAGEPLPPTLDDMERDQQRQIDEWEGEINTIAPEP